MVTTFRDSTNSAVLLGKTLSSLGQRVQGSVEWYPLSFTVLQCTCCLTPKAPLLVHCSSATYSIQEGPHHGPQPAFNAPSPWCSIHSIYRTCSSPPPLPYPHRVVWDLVHACFPDYVGNILKNTRGHVYMSSSPASGV